MYPSGIAMLTASDLNLSSRDIGNEVGSAHYFPWLRRYGEYATYYLRVFRRRTRVGFIVDCLFRSFLIRGFIAAFNITECGNTRRNIKYHR